jgi:hypothetical protein
MAELVVTGCDDPDRSAAGRSSKVSQRINQPCRSTASSEPKSGAQVREGLAVWPTERCCGQVRASGRSGPSYSVKQIARASG